MANDYGYFGSGNTGYAHYKQSLDRNFGGSGVFCFFFFVVCFVVAALVLLAM